MKEIAIYGAGGFGLEVAWLAESSCGYKVLCLVDDNSKLQGKKINNLPVIRFDELKNNFPKIGVVVANGTPKTRQNLTEKVTNIGFKIESLIHPSTEMSKWVTLDDGVVICSGCVITTNIQIGKYTQINLNCTLGHNVLMGDYTTLAPGVHLSGWVHMGKRVYVGTGTTFVNGTEQNPIIIGDDVVIGAGACVTKSIPPGETWVGVPARKLK
jgi:sugar O-acyltransferase (sialic acid O-acetyltransferase NeuD family)